MKVALPLIVLLALTACGAPTPAPEPPAPPAVPAAPKPPSPPRPPAAAEPILAPLARADWASRLEPGFGCSLERGDDILLVAVSGDAVARIAGWGPRHMSGVPTDLNTLARGGRFDAGFATIEITLARGGSETMEETVSRPVRVDVRSGTRRQQFEAAWVCGS